MKQRVDYKQPYSLRWHKGFRIFNSDKAQDQHDLCTYVAWLEAHPNHAKHVRVVAL